METKIAKQVKYSLQYEDGGDKMSLEIDSSEKNEDLQVSINSDSIYCSKSDLIWLQEHIGKALEFMEKEH